MFMTQMLYFFILLMIVACINTLFIWQGNFYFGIGLIAFGIFHIIFKFVTKRAIEKFLKTRQSNLNCLAFYF